MVSEGGGDSREGVLSLTWESDKQRGQFQELCVLEKVAKEVEDRRFSFLGS